MAHRSLPNELYALPYYYAFDKPLFFHGNLRRLGIFVPDPCQSRDNDLIELVG